MCFCVLPIAYVFITACTGLGRSSHGYMCFCVLPIAYVFITAWGWGDPHITTLDNRVYTFNGLGEYTLLQLTAAGGNFTLQGRTELVVNSTATQFSAFAFGSLSADIIEVS